VRHLDPGPLQEARSALPCVAAAAEMVHVWQVGVCGSGEQIDTVTQCRGYLEQGPSDTAVGCGGQFTSESK
jgi:hypothetical protein